MSSLSAQGKGSRNRRRSRGDSSSPKETGKHHGNPGMEPFTCVCDQCKTLINGAKRYLELRDFHDVNWSDVTYAHLEEIFLSYLDMVFTNAIGIVSSYGYSEVIAGAAVLHLGTHRSCIDVVSCTVDIALKLLRSGNKVDCFVGHNFDAELHKVERKVLGDVVSLLRESRLFTSAGDALWYLLTCNMDFIQALAIRVDYPKGSANDDPLTGPVADQLEGLSSSTTISYPPIAESGVESLSTMLPYPQNTLQREGSTALGIPNVPYGRYSLAANMQNMPSNFKPSKKSQIAFSVHVEESRSLYGSREKANTGSSKMEALLWQKLAPFEKSYGTSGTKAAMRESRHGGFGYLSFDRKSMYNSDTLSISLKSSTPTGKRMGGYSSQVVAAHNISSSSSSSPKPLKNWPPNSSPDSEHSCHLASKRSSTASNKQGCSFESSSCSSYDTSPFDKMPKDWVPQDKKDELALILVLHVRELQAQTQDWKHWAQRKVSEATCRLFSDKAELQSLRQGKKGTGHLQEKQNLEDSTRRKFTELETAISNANGELEKSDASANRIESRNTRLRLQMETAKLQAAESAANCQELSKKEMETLKRLQSWETERTFLHEEATDENLKLSKLRQQLEQAKQHRNELQTRWMQEEKNYNETLKIANHRKEECKRIQTSAKSEENLLKVKAENDRQRYTINLQGLKEQISQLELVRDSSRTTALRWHTDDSHASLFPDKKKGGAQLLARTVDSKVSGLDDVQRERECVMCLSEEMSVVFLPCAHQAVCRRCNELHEKQGMKDCPSCRTPVQRRICARFADCLQSKT